MNLEQQAGKEVASSAPLTAQQIVERISAAISDHSLPPGTKLGEDRLATALGVTRTKVREALQLLSHQNLVTLQPNRGAFIAEPTVKETVQLLEARRVVESAMASAAAGRHDKATIAELAGLIDVEASAWDRNDRKSAVAASRQFHMTIARLSGNEVLAGVLENVLSRSSLAVAIYDRKGAPGCLCDEHVAILDRIANSDGRGAGELMVEHINHMERRMNLVPDEDVEVDFKAILSSGL